MKVLFFLALICVTVLSEDQAEEAPDLYTKIEKAFGQLQNNFDGADTKLILEKLQAVLADSVEKAEPAVEALEQSVEGKLSEAEAQMNEAEEAAQEKLAEEKVEAEKTVEESKQELEQKLEKVVKEMKEGDWTEWKPEEAVEEQDDKEEEGGIQQDMVVSSLERDENVEEAAPEEEVAVVAAKPSETPIAFVLFLFAFGVSVLSFAVYYLFNQKEEARWANIGGYTSFNNSETHSLMKHGHYQKSGYYQQGTLFSDNEQK